LGGSRGYAMKMLGMRVFNRCTGEILVSKPPSTGTVDRPGLEDGCRAPSASDDQDKKRAAAAAAGLPAKLSTNQISASMTIIRPQVFACFEKYKVPGQAQFEYVVAGNGTVTSVRLSGAFFGTPTGVCLLEAGRNAHFPAFARDHQEFTYPFFLRQ
jgi:hypothetical protein